MRVTISEARLNDLVYMALKKFLTEPLFGEDTCPRECDIRVVMNLVEPDTFPRGSKLVAAILLPNEKAPASHRRMYDIETNDILRHAIDYMEDHWMKQTVEDAYQNANIRKEMQDYYAKIVEAVLATPEGQCGPQR